MKSEYQYIGQRIERPDAADKTKGKIQYVGDMNRLGLLYGKLLTSDKAHAKVIIDKAKAMTVKGVIAVFTNDDVPQTPYNSNQWFPGAIAEEDEFILHKIAKHVGDRIALVVGETPEAADRGINELIVTYEELPVVIGIDEAKKDNAIIFGKSNLAFEKSLSCGDISQAFKKADYIIEDIGSTPKIHHSAIENHACLTEIDSFGNLVVWSPCQVVFQVQHIVAKALGIPYDKTRVIKTTIGGSFGGKGIPILEPICAFATLKLNKPVQIVMERQDSVAGTRTRNASRQRIRTGITKDGRIVAREIVSEFDGGAYSTNAAAIVMAFGKKAFRLYKIQDQKYTGRTFYTNTTPGGACRGYGSPQLHAISELNIDNAAKAIGMDPVEFRLLNAVDPQEFILGAKDDIGMPGIGNARLKDCLNKGMIAFNWKEKTTSVSYKNTDRYAYGIGVAAGVHGNGYHGGFPDYTNVEIQVMPDNRILVKMGIHDLGCGTVLTMQQIAAETLSIEPNRINIPQADTFFSPYDSAGTQASRVTFVNGGALKEAAEQLRKKMMTVYSNIFDCSVTSVKLTNGKISHDNGKEISYGDLAILSESRLESTLKITLEYKSKGNPGVYAVSFAEVKVDKYTGLVEVLDLLAVQDAGQVINLTLAEGQVEGGAQMSIGMTLSEEIKYDEQGNLKTENFSKYHLINAPSMPKIRTIFIQDGEPLGPYGAKSIGELAAVTPGPAVMNAINNALGTNISDYPATPERIIEALSQKI
jgi:xanthine dehydrogenase molybdenum-binding subunit